MLMLFHNGQDILFVVWRDQVTGFDGSDEIVLAHEAIL
jgi:hypothetical protein